MGTAAEGRGVGAGGAAPSGPMRMTDLQYFELTDAGGRDVVNEDSVAHWAHDDGLLFAVADGVGEHPAGRLASELALQVLEREMGVAAAGRSMLTRLRRAFAAANLELYQKSLAVPSLHAMGTTLTATALVGGSLVTAHVGDCRLCLVRQGRLTQLTKDHTWGWEAHDSGRLSRDEADRHPRRHELSRRLGQELIVPVDLLSMTLRPDDVLLQCSDGLHAALSEQEIAELLLAHPPEAACRALVRRARQSDGGRNVSVQVARVLALPAKKRPWWWLGW
jgi:serine/threonine protein phosphatase PrpC